MIDDLIKFCDEEADKCFKASRVPNPEFPHISDIQIDLGKTYYAIRTSLILLNNIIKGELINREERLETLAIPQKE